MIKKSMNSKKPISKSKDQYPNINNQNVGNWTLVNIGSIGFGHWSLDVY